MTLRNIIDIDERKCDGCGQCVPACAEGAIKIVNGKAKLVADAYCDGLGACLGECPRGAIRLVEREAKQFDERLVQIAKHDSYVKPSQAHLLSLDSPPKSPHAEAARSRLSPAASHSGCPGMAIERFSAAGKNHNDGVTMHSPDDEQASDVSELTNWPIQLHLVPAHAAFLQGTDLLLAADCVPAAMPDFHRRFLRDRTLLIGCPKLDDPRAYVEKLAAIFRAAAPRSLTVVHMEVPCCTALTRIAAEAKAIANSNISIDEAVITRRGEVLRCRSQDEREQGNR